MGSNAKGNLGIGDVNTQSSSIPCLVESILEIKANKISCGYYHTLLTTDNGEVFSWGDGENGATGFDKTLFEPKQIPLFKEKHIFVKRASCGSRHTAFVTCKLHNQLRDHYLLVELAMWGNLALEKAQKKLSHLK